MVTAYKARHCALAFDSVNGNTSVDALPELLKRHEELGGYDPRTGKLTPFKNMSDQYDKSLTKEYLDSIAAAIEAGLGNRETFIKDFFAEDEDWQMFAALLDEHSKLYWLNVRHFDAFLDAVDVSEEDALTYAAFADRIRYVGQLEKLKPKKNHLQDHKGLVNSA